MMARDSMHYKAAVIDMDKVGNFTAVSVPYEVIKLPFLSNTNILKF